MEKYNKSVSLIQLSEKLAESLDLDVVITSKAKKTALVRNILESAIDEIIKITASGTKVNITNFGKFEKKHRNPRACQNFVTGELMKSEAKDVLFFSSAYTFPKANA